MQLWLFISIGSIFSFAFHSYLHVLQFYFIMKCYYLFLDRQRGEFSSLGRLAVLSFCVKKGIKVWFHSSTFYIHVASGYIKANYTKSFSFIMFTYIRAVFKWISNQPVYSKQVLDNCFGSYWSRKIVKLFKNLRENYHDHEQMKCIISLLLGRIFKNDEEISRPQFSTTQPFPGLKEG